MIKPFYTHIKHSNQSNMASTMNTPTNTNTSSTTENMNELLFKFAAHISAKNPQVTLEQALAMAQAAAKTDVFTAFKDASRAEDASVKSSKKSKKQKKEGPKRAKNAYMFYLAQYRNALTKELLSAIMGMKADAKNYEAAEDIKQLISGVEIPSPKEGEDMKVPVKFVTKLAGTRWKSLSEEAQAPFKKLAEDDTAAKKAEFEATQANKTEDTDEADAE